MPFTKKLHRSIFICGLLLCVYVALAFATTARQFGVVAAARSILSHLMANGGAANFSYAGLTSLNFDPVGVQGYVLGGTTTADFNGDGLIDLVAASGNLGKAYLFLRNAALNPPFDAPLELTNITANEVANPRNADFNGDGNPDLALAVDGQDRILLGNGDGSFTAGTSLPGVCVFGDFNGDGHLDAFYPNVLLPGNGDGTFGTAQDFPSLSVTGAPITGDWDGDGIADVAFSYLNFAGSTNVDILFGSATAPFSRTETVMVYSGAGGFSSFSGSGDFDGDGLDDIVTLARIDSSNLVTYTILLNNAAAPGQLSVGPSFASLLSPQGGGGFQVADFNGDGNADVLVPGGPIQFGVWFGGVNVYRDYYLNPSEANGNARRFGNLHLPGNAFVAGDFSATPDGLADVTLIAELGASLWESQAGSSYNAPSLTANNLMLEQGGPFLNVLLGSYTPEPAQRVALSFKAPVGWTDFEYGVFSTTNFDLSNGQVRANLRAACSLGAGNYPASVFLIVANPGGLAAKVALPLTVSGNAAPSLGNYPATTVALAGGATVTPSAPPADTGSTPAVSVAASVNFTGVLAVDATTGVVTITNASPVGLHTITVTATDGCGATASSQFILTVNSALPTMTHLSSTPNPSLYNQLVTFTATVASNGNPVTTGTVTFKDGATALANPVALNGGNTATLITSALSPGAHTITAEYSGTSQYGASQSNAVTQNVGCPTITISPATLPPGQVGVAYNQTITASPPGGNYTYSFTQNPPPTWLQIDAATGALTGTPPAAGTFNFTVLATGFNGTCLGTRLYTLTVNSACSLPVITAQNPLGGNLGRAAGQSASFSVTASGTGLSYQWFRNGAPIPGATDNVYAIAYLLPTDEAEYYVVVSNSCGSVSSNRVQLIVFCPQTTLTPASEPTLTVPFNLPEALAGATYSQSIIAGPAGGNFSYQIINAHLRPLPPGLTLNSSSGQISGTPTQAGLFDFYYKATG